MSKVVGPNCTPMCRLLEGPAKRHGLEPICICGGGTDVPDITPEIAARLAAEGVLAAKAYRDRARAMEVRPGDRDAEITTLKARLAEVERVIERIRDELMAANLDVSTDDAPDTLPHHVFVLRMALETRGENMDALAADRDRLRSLLAEACELADEANGDPSSCSYIVPVGERVAEIKAEVGK